MGMREPTYFLLAGLLDGPRHGYAIAQVARELSDGRVGLSAGTLYGALDRLDAALFSLIAGYHVWLATLS